MQPHEEWLFKADHDLKSAGLLLASEYKLLDAAIYHTQQCAEKSLKAVLSFHKRRIGKTHSLMNLLEVCIGIDEQYQSIYDDCVFLDPFSTLYRYPEGDLLPEEIEVREAISAATKIYERVTAGLAL
ncbi:hypothetical protein DC28_06145 [Spirochaeta lutea]|uniref:HEPN domain-containing protein n=2 Tax=Spirochaeta lutea TaxID=1480694 RepID=A0A098QZG9_9SPIO|nr:hypothetical protein DC28_06145 [Spirochaeta lutea]